MKDVGSIILAIIPFLIILLVVVRLRSSQRAIVARRPPLTPRQQITRQFFGTVVFIAISYFESLHNGHFQAGQFLINVAIFVVIFTVAFVSQRRRL